MHVLVKAYNIITDSRARCPVPFIETVDGLDATNKSFLFVLMANGKLLGVAGYDTHMEMNTSTPKYDISIAREPQKHISGPSRENGVIYQVKYRK